VPDQRVVLCGLSGVLLQHDEPYQQAVIRSCAQLLGIEEPGIRYQPGVSDPDTLARTLAAGGARPADLAALTQRAAGLLRENLQRDREAIAAASRTPGSAELLIQLKHRQQAPISLLTGHSRENARTLLTAIGLDRYLDFDLGGFGDEAADRTALVSLAYGKVATKCGAEQADRIVVVTDLAEDLAAASERGLRAVGIATSAGAARLTGAGATRVLAGLADVPAALAAMLD
jgi:phosphoglycolate phosphatase